MANPRSPLAARVRSSLVAVLGLALGLTLSPAVIHADAPAVVPTLNGTGTVTTTVSTAPSAASTAGTPVPHAGPGSITTSVSPLNGAGGLAGVPVQHAGAGSITTNGSPASDGPTVAGTPVPHAGGGAVSTLTGPSVPPTASTPAPAASAPAALGGAPAFQVDATCDVSGNGHLTITDVGGDMTTPFTWRLDLSGTPIATNTFQLAAGGTTAINTAGLYGTLTLSVLDASSTVVATGSTVCQAPPPPSFTVSATCDASGSGTLIITDVGGDMTTPFTWSLALDGTPIATNPFQLTAGSSTTIHTAGLFGTLVLSVLDTSGTVVATGTAVCQAPPPPPPPSFTIGATCDVNGSGTLTITDVGGDMTTPFTWSLALDGTPIATNPFQLTAGNSTTIHTAGLFGTLVLSVLDTSGTVVATGTTVCQAPPPPSFTVSATCDASGSGTLTITDVGGDMTTPFTWSLALDGTPIATNPFQLTAGSSTTIHTAGLFGTLVLSVLDTSSKVVATGSTVCQATPPPPPPSFTITGSCDADGNGLLTITDVGGDMTTPFTWRLTLGGTTIAQSAFQLAAGQSTHVNTSDLCGTLTLSVLDPSNTVVATGSITCRSHGRHHGGDDHGPHDPPGRHHRH